MRITTRCPFECDAIYSHSIIRTKRSPGHRLDSRFCFLLDTTSKTMGKRKVDDTEALSTTKRPRLETAPRFNISVIFDSEDGTDRVAAVASGLREWLLCASRELCTSLLFSQTFAPSNTTLPFALRYRY